MSAGRPQQQHPSHDDLLHLDDDNEGPVYSTGQPPPVTDHDMLHAYNATHDDTVQPRMSESQDDFVGASHHPATTGLPGGPGQPAVGGGLQPPGLGEAGRQYSQSSALGNYQRYSDIENDQYSDTASASGYYAAGGGIDEDNIPGLPLNQGGSKHRSRNSILSLGGGLMGRAKNALGMAPEYSEMDLPLTEQGARLDRAQSGTTEATVTDHPQQNQRKTPGATFKFGLPSLPGRKKVDPATLGPRVIHLNNPPANTVNKYVDNHVSTTKYNFATFLPKFLFEQFSKYANLFFLFTAILQQIPNISPTNRYTTIVPLGIVVAVSAVKEIIEDNRRKSQDRELNRSPAKVLRGTQFQDVKWIDVSVGDIIRIESEEPFPADVVLLASSEPEGLCYIETANLDGETNLKIKQAIPETSTLVSSAELARLGGRIRSEQPNSSLYTYEATLTMQAGGGEEELPLSPEQLLLRGATLRNTPWVHGVVVFTGHETKLMRNATATPIKRTNVEHRVNTQILLLGAILIILSVISSIGDVAVRVNIGKSLWYLDYEDLNVASRFFSDVFTYWILYSNLVPISLFVTVEIIKYYQAFLISSDLDIYYPETDMPANCRTSSLVEELGQVEYIFSDKTGTLTRNMMEFRQCSIGGIQYADEVPEDRRVLDDSDPGASQGIYDFKALERHRLAGGAGGKNIEHFLTLLGTCHTVIPETKADKPGEIKYQAASPDEGALVEGAVTLGYKFITRQPRAVTVLVDGQREERYELLAVCEFNSTRKRMSCIYRCPDGRIRCYTKGADTVILERLGQRDETVEKTLLHLEEYAAEGLRTLCLAVREVPEAEFHEWWDVFNTAATTVTGNRAEELDKAAELIEHDFTLLGATAIEDKLQEGVPDTIHTLQTAGIKVWVLTGDRQETAINIGMSCKLISEDMTLLIVNEENAEATRQNIEKKLEAIRSQHAGGVEMETLALVIDGKSLTFALEKDMEKLFLDLAVMCKAVICCRVSPLQKALVVKLVKRHLKSILLAIGDGANDVSMIQAAHIGVGISGVEGLQAARSADVSIAQFRYLRKLLLVHGSWSYQRISKVILYFYYKNTALFITQFWYSFQNAFSGQVIYESWTLSFFNVIFTVMPPFVLGIFDQFVNARLLDRYPQLYQLSQKGVFFRTHNFWSWVANGFYHSLLLYFVSELIWWGDGVLPDGKVAGHWVWGTALYTAGLVTVLGKAALITNIWTKYTVIAIPGSLAIWFIFLPIYAFAAPRLGFSEEYTNVLPVLMGDPNFWLMSMLALPGLCLVRDFAWKYAKRMYFPQSYHHVQEIQKYNIQDYRPRMEQFQKAIRKLPLTLIVAATPKNGIGNSGGLPWPMLKKEMAYFARVTKRTPTTPAVGSVLPDVSKQEDTDQKSSNVVIMGRKTWESIPPKFRPLKDRTNLVVSTKSRAELGNVPDTVVVGSSIADCLNDLEHRVKHGQAPPIGKAFVIGGSSIYEAALKMPQTKSILLTRIQRDYECDTHFPEDIDKPESGWQRKTREELSDFVGEEVSPEPLSDGSEDDPVSFEFRLYERQS
ncbi:putative phospholipid-transporting [Hortaea werneckii]|nr:putative phospholipid-transporting [Hortaea werneckii]KAI6910083.1 putative phospholipid-transporting [Hortaea werneckii]KAI6925522.1 putative phospholipid-transporting [Hortaea werneckii]KAI6959311.1 putative phospholipid-transporting [Hortaea werneckii]KAI6969394.1 putative phospholipid-transporting [Hortaea werneckii]